MLKKFKVKNYKNFKDEIVIDFENHGEYQFNKDCISNDLISKILIYGRNGTGKTNLGKALLDIRLTICSDDIEMIFSDIGNGILLNADSKENIVTFNYTFKFDTTEVIYQYSKLENGQLANEELKVDGEKIFDFNFNAPRDKFYNLAYVGAETANTDRYLENLGSNNNETRLPFLRWLINNVALKNDSILRKLYNYIKKMAKFTYLDGEPPLFALNQGFYESLEKDEELKRFENFLNSMGIKCELTMKKLPDRQQELYFYHKRLVPFFENASSGTLTLVELYKRLIKSFEDASLIYLDEFDAFYHYEIAEKVILFFKEKYPNCQVIITSHNTNLMTNRIMRPDCLFILSGEGKLTALCNATKRELREGHNLEKMYISGEFDEYE